jgi:hypothetical protein
MRTLSICAPKNIGVIVKEHLAAIDQKELERREAELRDVEKRLANSEAQFMTRLDDLLKRKILNEQEFAKANQAARVEVHNLEARKKELKDWTEEARARTNLADALPQSIKTFVEAFEILDVRQQKAQLQMILKAVHVYNDGHTELEFRQ